MSNVIERIGQLLTNLQSPDFYEREEAVKELGRYTEDEAVAGLVLALEDTDLGIRELAADVLGKMQGEIVSQLLIRFLAHGDIGTRNLAAEILVRIGAPAIQSLVEALESDDPDVRKFVVDVLGLIKDESAVKPLCKSLSDENDNVVCSAAEALGEIGSSKAISELVAAYQRCEDSRLQVIEALGKIGDPSSLDMLFGFLKTDDPVILYAAIEAIGNIGLKNSIEKLLAYLDHEDRTIAEAALTAIIDISIRHGGKIDCDLPLDKFSDFLFDGIKSRNSKITDFTLSRLTNWYGRDVMKSLLEVLDFVDEETLKHVSEIIEQIGPNATEPILKMFPRASSHTKLVLLEILRGFTDHEIAVRLTDFVDDPDPEIRRKIAHTLGLSGIVETSEVLKRLASDEVGHVRAAAFGALGWLCTEEDTDILFRGLEDKYVDVREAAMGALVVAGGPRVVAKFTADLYHQDAEKQRLAVTALGMIGETEVVEPLLKAVNHPEPEVRKSAINSLARIGQVPDVKLLSLALNDENTGVRKAAVTALITLRGEDAIPDIRFLLDDEDVWVCYHAITAIGSLGQSKHADLLLPFLKNDQDILKIAAIKALSQMGCRQVLPDIKGLQDEKNSDITKAVEMAVTSLEGE
ncbi:MAG: HEAT repeat domain-containing protein [bacterium]